ncbi:MAG: hypothetical protein DRJ42_19695 [Deltaproteobacteria bacterium]|nr:MAG: hypothetical protein DRJ42_19695 [Deltaproteobacteria bacterium]
MFAVDPTDERLQFVCVWASRLIEDPPRGALEISVGYPICFSTEVVGRARSDIDVDIGRAAVRHRHDHAPKCPYLILCVHVPSVRNERANLGPAGWNRRQRLSDSFL